jgi:hypothetical protein
MRSVIFSINQTFQRILSSIAQGGGAVGPQRPLNLPWTKKAPLDLFNAHRWAVPPPLGTTGLQGPAKEYLPPSPTQTAYSCRPQPTNHTHSARSIFCTNQLSQSSYYTQASAPILAQRPAYQILAYFCASNSCFGL